MCITVQWYFLLVHTQQVKTKRRMNFKSCSFKALQRVLSLVRLCNPKDYSPSGSSVHVTSQARVMERVATFSSRGSSLPRDWTQVSCLAAGFFTTEPSGNLTPPLSTHNCFPAPNSPLSWLSHLSPLLLKNFRWVPIKIVKLTFHSLISPTRIRALTVSLLFDLFKGLLLWETRCGTFSCKEPDSKYFRLCQR